MALNELAHLLGRVLFSFYFILAGIRHLTKTKGIAAYYTAVSNGPMPEATVIVTGLMLLAGGSSMLLGYHPRIGAAILVAFLVPVSIVMHAYWKETDMMARGNQDAQFWKNITLAGAAIFIGANPHWPWPFSVG
jgi:putative oxidoreductase